MSCQGVQSILFVRANADTHPAFVKFVTDTVGRRHVVTSSVGALAARRTGRDGDATRRQDDSQPRRGNSLTCRISEYAAAYQFLINRYLQTERARRFDQSIDVIVEPHDFAVVGLERSKEPGGARNRRRRPKSWLRPRERRGHSRRPILRVSSSQGLPPSAARIMPVPPVDRRYRVRRTCQPPWPPVRRIPLRDRCPPRLHPPTERSARPSATVNVRWRD